MRFSLTFKTPGAGAYETFVEDAEREVIRRHGLEVDHIDPEDEEKVDEYNDVAHAMYDFAKRWVSHGEYITVEFDTELGTCRAVKA